MYIYIYIGWQFNSQFTIYSGQGVGGDFVYEKCSIAHDQQDSQSMEKVPDGIYSSFPVVLSSFLI